MVLEMRSLRNFKDNAYAVKCNKCGKLSERAYCKSYHLKCPLCGDKSIIKFSYVFEAVAQRIKYYNQKQTEG